MTNIFYTSPEHKQRWLTTMLATDKIDRGKLDPEYGSALYILTASVGTWNKAQSYVSRHGIQFEELINKVDFSSGNLALVRLAANLFNEMNEEGQKVRPIDLMILDDTNFTVALTAFQIRRVNWPLHELATKAELYNLETDIRDHSVAENRSKPWLPFMDGE